MLPVPVPFTGGSSSPVLPTSNLLAQFDASDTAAHDPVAGIWSPSAGSDGINWQFKNAGVNASFSYAGTTQNGLSVIQSPTSHNFVPVSQSASSISEFIILAAYRVDTFVAAANWTLTEDGGSSSLLFFQCDTVSVNQLVYAAVGNAFEVTRTNQNVGDGSFRIFGTLFKSLREGYISTIYEDTNITAAANMALYNTLMFPSATTNLFFDRGNLGCCELLMYSVASPGTLALAQAYLQQKWAP